MIIGACTVELRLYEVNSLKEKRQIVKSIIGRIQSRFNISIAEVEKQEIWGRTVIGFVCVTTTVKHANQIINNIIKFIEGDARAELIDQNIDIF